jgi:hypothetical protein
MRPYTTPSERQSDALPVYLRTSTRPRKRTSLRQTASFEPSSMFVRRSVRPLRDCEKKNTKKYQKKKVTKSLYFTYAWGRPYSTDCNGSWHIGLGHQHYQSYKFLWLEVKGFGFCEGSNLGFSHRKLTWPLQHCLALTRWHVKIIYNINQSLINHDNTSTINNLNSPFGSVQLREE